MPPQNSPNPFAAIGSDPRLHAIDREAQIAQYQALMNARHLAPSGLAAENQDQAASLRLLDTAGDPNRTVNGMEVGYDDYKYPLDTKIISLPQQNAAIQAHRTAQIAMLQQPQRAFSGLKGK